jgi:hypothetical protein
MSTNIDYFGDFISGIVISADRLEYIKTQNIEILTCEPYKGVTSVDYLTFYITFKVTNMTFLYFMQAGIKYSMDKYYKP